MGRQTGARMQTAMQGKIVDIKSMLSSASGRLFAACWALAIVIVVCFGLFGLFDRDIAGAIAVGTLFAAPLIDLAIVASYWSGTVSHSLARTTWLALSVALLASTLSLLQSGYSDADLILAYGAAIFSFPLGLIAGPLTAQMSMHSGPTLTSLLWVLSIGAGSVQWFVLIPMFVRARARANLSVHRQPN